MLCKNTYRNLKRKIIINESNEELIAIPNEFLRYEPHPYESIGAPYKDKSPFYLRQGVVDKLRESAKKLDMLKSGYKLKIFDAFRPIEVQKFMIDYDKERIALERYDTSFDTLQVDEQNEVLAFVQTFWSPISEELELNPPPHSTGAALDVTIVDENGIELDMGTKIDELSELSYSDYFENSDTLYQENRDLLYKVMSYAGFVQLPTEWWHFSYGDQIWAIYENTVSKKSISAKYGLYNLH